MQAKDYYLLKKKEWLMTYEEQVLRERIEKLEQWIAGIADDHPQIPDWLQQSAKDLLAEGAE